MLLKDNIKRPILFCRFMKGTLTDEQKAHTLQLQLKMADLERKVKAFEMSLPSQAG